MKRILSTSLVLTILCGVAVAQSLAEAARREAERRKSLEQQGVEGKVIEGESLPRRSSAGAAASGQPKNPAPHAGKESSTGRRSSAGSYRTTLNRIDNEIRRCEERLAALQRRHEAEKYTLPRSGRIVNGRAAVNTRERIFWQIQDLESKLKRLRQERLEAYDAGKKAGLLPGELDGHGIIP